MAEILRVDRIESQADHAAFTDLTLVEGELLLTFREGRSHVSSDGTIRVLRSADGRRWRSAANLTIAGRDLRDADVTPLGDGRFALLAGCCERTEDGGRTRRGTGTVVSFSDTGERWSKPVVATPEGRWLWRAERMGDELFGFAYGGRNSEDGTVLDFCRSSDGQRWETSIADVLVDGSPSEAVLRCAPDGSALALVRRDAPDSPAMLGTSTAPFRRWQWRALDRVLHCPNLMRVEDRWIVAGRGLDPDAHVALYALDPKEPRLEEILRFESSGDCGYPGLVWHDERAWVSFYSSHHERTAVYLAQVRLS